MGSLTFQSCEKNSDLFSSDVNIEMSQNQEVDISTDDETGTVKGGQHSGQATPFSGGCPGGGEDEDPIWHSILQDENGNPLAGEDVDLLSPGVPAPTVVATAQTDANGRTCFQVTPGDYSLAYRPVGYTPDTTGVESITTDTSSVHRMD